jgi:hypothetical protein
MEKSWDCECGTCGKEMNGECGGMCDRREGREFYETCNACAEKEEKQVCPECGEMEVLTSRAFNPAWEGAAMCCDECYHGEKERVCETCECSFLPKADGTYNVCGDCYDDEKKEVCEVCGAHEGDNALFQGHNGAYADKWCCRDCVTADDELGEQEDHTCLQCGAKWVEDARGEVVSGRECGHG